jgi:hypothetical protein
LPERNLNNVSELLDYLGSAKRTDRFVEGNVYVLSKKIVNRLFTDLTLYNVLNAPGDFDYNWVCKRYGLSGGVNSIYNEFKTQNLAPRDALSFDGYVEHAFERTVLHLCDRALFYPIEPGKPLCRYSVSDMKQYSYTVGKFTEPVRIDLAVPMYHGASKSKRELSIVFLKYLRYASDTLAEYNIHLSFTIVGSDKQDSLDLFNTHLKKNPLDEYFEFDQEDVDYSTLPEGYRTYNHDIFRMLHNKFSYCFEQSWKKNVDIYAISGSNDFIDISFYIDAAYKFNGDLNQIYGLNKGINVSAITSEDKVLSLDKNKTVLWDLDYRGGMWGSGDLEFSGGILGVSPAGGTEVKSRTLDNLLSSLRGSGSAYNEVVMERTFISGGFIAETIKGCFSINYKAGGDLTSMDTVLGTISDRRVFATNHHDLIFATCSDFWDNVRSL